MQPNFGPTWVQQQLYSRIGEIKRSTIDARQLAWIDNLSLLLKIHLGLIAMGLQDLDAYFTRSINAQKAYLDFHGVPQPQAVPVIPTPLASGAIPVGKQDTFSIEEIASKDTKIVEGFMEDLYLVWQEDIGKLKCFKGPRNISATFPSLLVIPRQVVDFRCSRENPRVLITSVVDDKKTLDSVYIRMADVAAAWRLFDLVRAHVKRRFKPSLEDR
ncbi:MAG: hypothetical protein Q9207_004199 [Kuettlingeria erythrocarpa]